MAVGTATNIEYAEHQFDHRDLFGFDLRTAVFGKSNKPDESQPRKATAAEPIRRELQLQPANVLRGRVVNEQGQPVAWNLFSINSRTPNGSNFTQSQWSSSHGRFATSSVPQDQGLQLNIGSRDQSLPPLTKSQDLGDIKLTVREQANIPTLNYHVDRWIHGSALPAHAVNRQLPVLVVHDTGIPVSSLQLLSYAYPKDKLTIVAIHYPGDSDQWSTATLQAELSVRKCAFSVGVDELARTRSALCEGALLFNFPSDEVSTCQDWTCAWFATSCCTCAMELDKELSQHDCSLIEWFVGWTMIQPLV